MAGSNKKRKLDTTEESLAVSAFALRKKLLGKQNISFDTQVDTTVITTVEHQSTDKVTSNAFTPSKKTKKTQSKQDVPAHSGDSEDKSEQNQQVVLPTTSETALEPLKNLSPSKPSASEDEEESLTAPVIAQFSTFKPSKGKYTRLKCSDNPDKVFLDLDYGERLVILGNYGISVLFGEISINGASLKAKWTDTYWVDAPYCYTLPVIRCVSEEAMIRLHSTPDAKTLRDLGRLSPLFTRLWNEIGTLMPGEERDTSQDTFQILYEPTDGPRRAILQDLVAPPEWNRDIAKFLTLSDAKPPSIMIAGPKSSGKSTFGKILANRFLTTPQELTRKQAPTEVAVLELDPGQPEYCPVGQIALVLIHVPILSPSFCRPIPCGGSRILRSHALAALSPAADPNLYKRAALDLMDYYGSKAGGYPLIINTPGWIQGTGLDILVSLIETLKPSEVVYMSESGPVEVVESLRAACSTAKLSTVSSQPTRNTSRTAAELRQMRMMSYFHAKSETAKNGYCSWDPTPVTAMPPWLVKYAGQDRKILGIMIYGYQIPPELLAAAIIGDIFAVVEVEDSQAFSRIYATGWSHDVEEEMVGKDADLLLADVAELPQYFQSTTPEGIPLIDSSSEWEPLHPNYSQCLGLALLRGIDTPKQTLQLLSPISDHEIEQVYARGSAIVLVAGTLQASGWAYTEDLYYKSRENEGVGSTANDGLASHGSVHEEGGIGEDTAATPTPWVQVLDGHEGREAGSRVLRVRRDLGRSSNATG